MQTGRVQHDDLVPYGGKSFNMFDKLIAWFRPSKSEREEALRLAQHARDVEHGHTHEHMDGIVHTHEHAHGDHEHDDEHGK